MTSTMEVNMTNPSTLNLTYDNSSEQTGSAPSIPHELEVTAQTLWRVFPPILMLLGTFGNIVTILVLCRKSMWKMAFSPYLVILSVADIVVLYTGLLRQWLRYLVGLDIRLLSPGACKLHIFSVYTATHFSVWILVAVSVERFIGVCFPFKAKTICTRRRTLATLVLILFLLMIFNSHFFYGMGTAYDNSTGTPTLISHCSELYDHYYTFNATIWPWMDLSVFSVIPFCIIIVCNISLISRVVDSHKRTRVLPSDSTANHRGKSVSMTALLVALNTLFLASTAPVTIYVVGYPTWSRHATADEHASLALWWAIVNALMYLNNSVNFILYCVSGPRFRQEMKLICSSGNKVGVLSEVRPSTQHILPHNHSAHMAHSPPPPTSHVQPSAPGQLTSLQQLHVPAAILQTDAPRL